MIAAGKLDRRINLCRFGAPVGRDEYNAPLYGPALKVRVWAEYEPVSADEGLASNEVAARQRAIFLIRHSSEVACCSPTWWLEFSGRAYDITGVTVHGRGDWIEITAAARAE